MKNARHRESSKDYFIPIDTVEYSFWTPFTQNELFYPQHLLKFNSRYLINYSNLNILLTFCTLYELIQEVKYFQEIIF